MSSSVTGDLAHMSRAIVLSKRGLPAPNPHVGCVITKGNRVVGEGYHHFAGGPHAEVEALAQAGALSQGATAYVTLEPCNHHGRTPPCSEALIKAGVQRVVIACVDPNPQAAGGIRRLREAGIEVEHGLLAEEASAANRQFLTAMQRQRPMIVLKVAASLDGRIALPNGASKWITGPKARRVAHRLRAECGAVLVGRNTVESDDPQLTARIPGVKNQPVRIVLDPKGRLDEHWRVFDSAAPTLHFVDGTYGLASDADGFDLTKLAQQLFRLGIHGVLVEGGATTISKFLGAGLVDRLELFLGPKVLGSGKAWLEGLNLDSMLNAPEFELIRLRNLEGDAQLTFRPKQGNFLGVESDISD